MPPGEEIGISRELVLELFKRLGKAVTWGARLPAGGTPPFRPLWSPDKFQLLRIHLSDNELGWAVVAVAVLGSATVAVAGLGCCGNG